MTCAGAGRSGIAHAEVDDVRPGVAGARLGLVHLFEHVRRQAADAVEIFHRLRPLSRRPLGRHVTPAGFYHGLVLAPVFSPLAGFGLAGFLAGAFGAAGGSCVGLEALLLGVARRVQLLFDIELLARWRAPGPPAAAACRARRGNRRPAPAVPACPPASRRHPAACRSSAPGAQPASTTAMSIPSKARKASLRKRPCGRKILVNSTIIAWGG